MTSLKSNGVTSPNDSVRHSTPLIETKSLSAGYGGMPAIRDVDMVVYPGETVALLGANGAGKTTTLMALAGELRPLRGEVLVQGRTTRSALERRAREGLGLVPEERSVFTDLTVAQNLNIGLGEVSDALAIFPELRPHLKRRAGLLSGGQQQMLTLARALAARPKLLLIDELSLGLAPVMVERLVTAVRDAAAQGVGVVVVEQQVSRAFALADRAYILQRGQVALQGKVSELSSGLEEIERAYFGSTVRDGNSLR